MKALTPEQIAKLRTLEPQLMECVKTANLDRAEELAKSIRVVFGADTSNHRFLRSLNWYGECAVEAHRYMIAISTLAIVRERASSNTRIYIEATAIQTVAYFRQKKFPAAKDGARIVIAHLNKIKSDARRRQFQGRFIERIQEECILAGLSGVSDEKLAPDKIHDKAVELVRQCDRAEIVALIESQIPGEAILLLKDLTKYVILQVRPEDRKFLEPPSKKEEIPKLGEKCISALRRVAWRTFCDPKSEIYDLWSTQIGKVFGRGYFASALAAALAEFKIGFPLMAAGIVAIAIKYGCKEFCATFKPHSLMIPPSEKGKEQGE